MERTSGFLPKPEDRDTTEARDAAEILRRAADVLGKLPSTIAKLEEKRELSIKASAAEIGETISSLEDGVNLVNSALYELPENLMDVDYEQNDTPVLITDI